MFTPSDKCPRRDACVQNGKGLIHMKDLTDKEGLYNHGRLFAHVTVDPGCSIGDHPHDHETEFYYIIKGEGVFNDNGKEIVVRPGDIWYATNIEIIDYMDAAKRLQFSADYEKVYNPNACSVWLQLNSDKCVEIEGGTLVDLNTLL